MGCGGVGCSASCTERRVYAGTGVCFSLSMGGRPYWHARIEAEVREVRKGFEADTSKLRGDIVSLEQRLKNEVHNVEVANGRGDMMVKHATGWSKDYFAIRTELREMKEMRDELSVHCEGLEGRLDTVRTLREDDAEEIKLLNERLRDREGVHKKALKDIRDIVVEHAAHEYR